MKYFTVRKLALATALASTLAPSAYAHQPNAVGWQQVSGFESGFFNPGVSAEGDDQVLINLFADHDQLHEHYLLAVFPECGVDPEVSGRPVLNLDEIIKNPEVSPKYVEDYKAPGPRWEICPDQGAVLLSGKEGADLKINVDFLRPVSEGMSPRLQGKVYEVPKEYLAKTDDPDVLARLLKRNQPAGDVTVDLYYRLDARKNVWQAGDYERIFGSPSEGEGETQSYEKIASIMPVEVAAYREVRLLPDSDGERNPEENLRYIYEGGSGLNTRAELGINDYLQIDAANYFKPDVVLGSGEKSSHSHTLTGKFSTRWTTDHSLHPGFGFRVEAWTNETGSWNKLASDWVQYNGYWTLQVPNSENFQGNHLRILYRSYNRYYRPQNQNGDTYSWKDPDQYNIGNSFNAGHRYADTDGGTYNGVGELVDAAMLMWSRLYWDGGINPVPNNALNLFFPNTWQNCGGASPWSCADTSGNIWLIAAHGTRANVVVHEMAHQLNNKFWNNKRPAGSGGSHSLNSCYPTRLGMALREGFANFLPAWVGYPSRNVATGGFGSGRWNLGYDAEQRVSPPNCSNGWENEVWVARAFWDLHDTRADGDDVLWFNHKGAVISLYLNNGVANNGDAMDMRDFENIYRNAASSGHQQYISDIFNQNRM